ncbi:MAG TPA: glycosyl transferase [Chitinophagaceae bacterium]|nr:glycosyl transferase [Chitinophagaceae bacterium]
MNWNLVIDIIFDILTYGIFIYSTLLLLSYIAIAIFSIGETRKYVHKNSFTDYRILASSVHAPSVTILAPAYNEGMTIVENIRSLLSIYYVNLELIVINDGSKDDCLQKMITAYDLEKIDYFVDYKIKTKEVRGVYKSRNPIYHKLLVVDKVNGGKADALNVGINISSNKYLVCIDVDCILEQDALLKMVKPFLEQTEEKVIASGGVVRIANSCIIEDGKLVKVKLATDYLPRMQILEYIRAFILGRMAWSRLNGLMLISGAFGAFDKEIAIKCGGYDHSTVGEDMELVVRMRRYMEERGEKYRVTYIPDPLCWTEAPNSFNILGRQRNRWTRGTIETLKFHKKMFFNPKYGLLGMLSYPYWFFFEMCAPVIEFFGFVCFFIFAAFGLLDWGFFFSYLLFIISFGYLYSAFAILMEVITYNQYKRRTDIFILMLTALTEPFYFHPFVVWSAIKGYIDYIRKKKSWGEMTRQGFAQKPAGSAPVLIDTTPVIVTPEPVVVIPEPVMEETAPVQKASFYKRKIAPVITKVPDVLFESFRYYIAHMLVLLLLLFVARGIELGIDYFEHGKPQYLDKIVLYGFAKDVAFATLITLWGYIPFTLLFLIGRKTAHVSFIVFGTLLTLIQVALSQYFVTSLVPLGADLWIYSWTDIQQTIGASGGLNLTSIALLVIAACLFVFTLIKIPRLLLPNDGLVVFFILIVVTGGIRDLTKVTSNMLPGHEFSNNLSLNKSYFFYKASYNHFFPSPEEEDIYRDDFFANAIYENKLIDKNNYPFLHISDSTKNVLAPFFTKNDSVPPNIVIVLVEGLGRAFSNENAYLGSFTPFLDSLSLKSLYWENFLSTSGRTFSVLPSVLGSLPFGPTGFNELGDEMPKHISLTSLLKRNGYRTSFYYGGDASFDNMSTFLKKSGIDQVNDEKTFPRNGYQKLPASSSGFSWGYDDASLFRYALADTNTSSPSIKIILTVATHSPFLINNEAVYINRFERRMSELKFSEEQKKTYRNYRLQYASILYADYAIQEFINAYKQRPDFANTVFLITGDHRMPEIPMSTKIDRYHVPLLIYSPLLNKAEKFSSVSSHFDIAPTLTAWLKYSHGMNIPNMNAWVGTGIDTAKKFRNIHAVPLKQTKPELVDFVRGDYMLNADNVFKIMPNMDLEPENAPEKKFSLKSSFNLFKKKNQDFVTSGRLLPDSLVKKYGSY